MKDVIIKYFQGLGNKQTCFLLLFFFNMDKSGDNKN